MVAKKLLKRFDLGQKDGQINNSAVSCKTILSIYHKGLSLRGESVLFSFSIPPFLDTITYRKIGVIIATPFEWVTLSFQKLKLT